MASDDLRDWKRPASNPYFSVVSSTDGDDFVFSSVCRARSWWLFIGACDRRTIWVTDDWKAHAPWINARPAMIILERIILFVLFAIVEFGVSCKSFS